jgi:predicted metal-dependent HD superfamily phosphohydrolase
MRFEEARNFLLAKLENELPADLNYHNIHHTSEVMAAAEELGGMENISGDDLIILKTAALFHDAGFLSSYEGHEEASCDLANSILPDFDYTATSIREICKLIRATQVPQKPLDKKAQILCDADLYYLGTNEYH